MNDSNKMLIDFSFENFASYRDAVHFSMKATADKTNEKGSVSGVGKDRILRCSAIYGANGSGKSNFVHAFIYVHRIVSDSKSVKDWNPSGNYFRLDNSSKTKPSYFELNFNYDGLKYRYGFESNLKKVFSEWLFVSKSTRETKLFTREGMKVSLGKSFINASKLVSHLKSDRLFLNLADENKILDAENVVDWIKFTRIQSGIFDTSGSLYTRHILKDHDEEDRQKILNILKTFDTQINDIYIINKDTHERVEKTDRVKKKSMLSRLKKTRARYDIAITRKAYEGGKVVGETQFELGEESNGTQRLVGLSALLIDVLDHGYPMVVDELEAKLHPLITKKIIEIFNSSKLNKSNSQIIFTTHDTNLLAGNGLRRDQVWFTEKDKRGLSHIYSLAEFKPRKDSSFEKNYIEGRYGAVPYLGNINDILSE